MNVKKKSSRKSFIKQNYLYNYIYSFNIFIERSCQGTASVVMKRSAYLFLISIASLDDRLFRVPDKFRKHVCK